MRGFTLVELMVSLVIIAILITIAVPGIQETILKGRLESAKSYLVEVAAKERMYNLRRGVYYASPTNDEQDLEDNLGVNLEDATNYCVMVRTSGFISSGDDIQFEVWAVLRNGDYSSGLSSNDSVAVEGMSGVGCVTADQKHSADGWAGSAGSGVGAEGQVVVLRYPGPAAGSLDGSSREGRAGIFLLWEDGGVSYSDPLHE